MKIAVVTPTRRDRVEFLKHWEVMLERQTVIPDAIYLVDYMPILEGKDITQRYKRGIQQAIEDGNDVIFFIEDDDWYRDDYIETCIHKWSKAGKPELFGFNETWYYDIRAHKAHHMKHNNHSSAFMTMAKASAFKNFVWPPEDYSFLDLKLWKQIRGLLVPLNEIIAIGIKHGVGLTGGQGHNTRMNYNHPNAEQWLKDNIDEASYEFYKNVVCK